MSMMSVTISAGHGTSRASGKGCLGAGLILLAVSSACSSSTGTSGAAGGAPSTSGSGGESAGGAAASGGSPSTGGTSTSSGGTPTSTGGTSTSTGGATGSGGSSVTTPQDGGTDSGRRGTGPGDWGPGDYPPDLNAQTYLELSPANGNPVSGQKGYTRQYKVHVPKSYDPNVPTPVVFCIHGLAQNAVMFCVAGAAMDKKSDEAGFILVMPNGYQNSWNAGTCCGGASTEQLDDVELFRVIYGEVTQHLNVDPGRVYATGLSNGGYMSYRLACEASDLFAAVAPTAGAIGENDIGGGTNPTSDFTRCAPTHPVSVLDIHGTADGLVPYSLQAPSLAHMVASDGCATTTTPAAVPQSGGDTVCVTYAGCPSGTEVTGCTVAGGGHCWFGSPDCGTGGGAIGAAVVGANSNTLKNTDAVWAFLSRFAR